MPDTVPLLCRRARSDLFTQTNRDSRRQHNVTIMSAAALPAPLRSYLSWGRTRLASLGLLSDEEPSIEGAVPGAPLCVARRGPGGEGFGLYLARDIPESEGAALLFRVPVAMQFRPEHSVVASALPPASEETAWVRTTIALLAEWALGERSAWAGFFAGMPQRTDQVQFWSDEQKAQLQGCSFFEGGRSEFFDLDHEYCSKILPWLSKHGATFGLSAREGGNCSFARFALVTGWMISRAFRPSCSPEQGPVLMPLVDLTNTTSLEMEEDASAGVRIGDEADDDGGEQGPFHRKINCTVRWVAGGEKGDDLSAPVLLIHTLPASKLGMPLRKGQQLFLPYGSAPLGSADLLVRYGFVEGTYPKSENPHDCVSLSPSEIVAQLQGGGPTGGPRGPAALTAPAEATEDEEARALHRLKHERRKQQEAEAAAEEAAAIEADAQDDDDEESPSPARRGRGATKGKQAASGSAKKNGTKQATPQRQQQASKRAGAKGAAAAAVAAASDSGNDSDDSEGSAASGSSLLFDSLSELASSLPLEAFIIPSSGAPPDRLVQFVGVVLGIVDGEEFKGWLEGDAQGERDKAKRELERNKTEAMEGGGKTDPPPPAAEEAAQQQPCPSPSAAIGGLSVSSSEDPRGRAAGAFAFGKDAASAAASASAAAASSPVAASASAMDSASSAALQRALSSPDVLEALFFLYHSLLAGYATTLQEDDKLLEFFGQQQKEKDAAGTTSSAAAAATKRGGKAASKKKKQQVASASASVPEADAEEDEASADRVRLLLAIRVRMSEKRVLYRALDWVQRRLVALASSADDDEDNAEMGSDEDASDAAEEEDEDEVDPTLTSPRLFKFMPQSQSQKRPLPAFSAAGAGAKAAGDEAEEEEAAVAHAGDAAATTPIRFTYTKGSSSHARKKRRG